MGNIVTKKETPHTEAMKEIREAMNESPENVRQHGRELMRESLDSLERTQQRLAEIKNSHVSKINKHMV